MNKQEAIKKLDFNSLLDYRERNRIFGNCDNQSIANPLTTPNHILPE